MQAGCPAQINSQRLKPTSAAMPTVQVAGHTATQNTPFLPRGGRNRRRYYGTYSPRDGQAEWAWMKTGMV